MKTFVMAAAAALMLCVHAPAFAGADDAAILKPIHQFVDGFNKDDANTALSVVNSDGSVVIDEFAPHVWQGKTSVADWMNDFEINSDDNGITDAKVTLGDTSRVVSNGKTAYAVLAATYDYKQKGVAMHEDATMTFALTKSSGAWLINGWSWNGQNPVAATP